MTGRPEYVHVAESAALPALNTRRAFKTVLIVEQPVPQDRRAAVARWLLDAGCLYAMCWGPECEEWRASLNTANQDAFDGGPIPDDRVLIATAHPRDSMAEALWFAKHSAMHPCAALDDTVLLHIGPAERERELIETHASA